MPIPRWRRTLLVAAALGLALPVSGCAPDDGPEPSGPGPGTSSAPSTPRATATATPTPTVASASAPPAATPSRTAVAARVTVQRSGGLAGALQEIVVEGDGRWRYRATRGPAAGTVKIGRLNTAQLKRLHLLLGDPSFGSAFYPGSCADGFHYSLRTGQRRVEWDDCGRGNPAEVARAIVALLTDVTAF